MGNLRSPIDHHRPLPKSSRDTTWPQIIVRLIGTLVQTLYVFVDSEIQSFPQIVDSSDAARRALGCVVGCPRHEMISDLEATFVDGNKKSVTSLGGVGYIVIVIPIGSDLVTSFCQQKLSIPVWSTSIEP